MNTSEIREELHKYINEADDKKVKAIYTMIEEDIHPNSIWNDDGFVAELERRVEALESGREKGLTFEEVQANARKAFKERKRN